MFEALTQLHLVKLWGIINIFVIGSGSGLLANGTNQAIACESTDLPPTNSS